ncbi:hypothetical protein EDD17DRAFT_1846589 [Pisolithus thermaeus]|nr:hypothetical protein EDD17DRAFT_1846589 [Pisolithus thermaeus]
MSTSERRYSVLLSSLRETSASTSLSTLIIRYLARLSPAPTPLAATIVGSPLCRPSSLVELDALKASFRHVVHTKLHLLKDAPTGLFLPSLNAQLNAWLVAGLLLGVEDILKRLPSKQRNVESSVQDEIVLAFADVIDLFTSSDSWGKEFLPETEAGEEHALTLSLITCAEAPLAVPPEKFVALPLPVSRLACRRKRTADLPAADIDLVIRGASFRVQKQGAPAFQDVHKVSSSPAMSNMGSLSRLCPRSISLFVDHRPKLALQHVQETFLRLESISRSMELGWSSTDLADAVDESIAAPETRSLSESVWTIPKILLFSTIMITEAGLSAVVYVPPETDSVVRDNAFPELKRAFYLALDILAEHKAESEHFVQQLCEELWSNAYVLSHPVQRAKKAFGLSAIEQLIPVLAASTIVAFVLPFCSPHLGDARHRDIFEAAHSVVLAILSHVHTQVVDSTPLHGSEHAVATATMVPLYTRCLIENSAEDGLNTTRLCLVFAALVKSASASGDHALARFCIDSLLTACKASFPAFDGDRVRRLHLALVSSASSLPLALLSHVLQVMDGIIGGIENDDIKCDELLDWDDRRVKWARSRLAIARQGTGRDGETGVPKELGLPSKL